MKSNGILFFADRLPPLIGGMEMHAKYFIEYFNNHEKFPLLGIVTKNNLGEDSLICDNNQQTISINELSDSLNPAFIFFNSGRWIEDLAQIKKSFPRATFIYRTGGNEILKAPLVHKKIPNHSLRQAYWAKNLNNFINILITNSKYTEDRLRKLGITCRFLRTVGGANTSTLKTVEKTSFKLPTVFCAARFVPYKNHHLLVDIAHKLALRGNNFRVRLAGDGPLLVDVKKQVNRYNLNSFIEFLGVLDNKEACKEIVNATLYVQLSKDQLTNVSGGSYIHSEGMGRSILEALSAGTYVVAGRSGALPEIVTKDRGDLVNLNDLERIADIIERMLKDPPAKLPFCDKFDWKNIFKRYEDLLENVE